MWDKDIDRIWEVGWTGVEAIESCPDLVTENIQPRIWGLKWVRLVDIGLCQEGLAGLP